MMSDLLFLIALVALLVLFEFATLRWGVDTRELDPRIQVRRNF